MGLYKIMYVKILKVVKHYKFKDSFIQLKKIRKINKQVKNPCNQKFRNTPPNNAWNAKEIILENFQLLRMKNKDIVSKAKTEGEIHSLKILSKYKKKSKKQVNYKKFCTNLIEYYQLHPCSGLPSPTQTSRKSAASPKEIQRQELMTQSVMWQ